MVNLSKPSVMAPLVFSKIIFIIFLIYVELSLINNLFFDRPYSNNKDNKVLKTLKVLWFS